MATCTVMPLPAGAGWDSVMVNGMLTSPAPRTVALASAIETLAPIATHGLALLLGALGLSSTKSALLSPLSFGRPAAFVLRT